MQDSILIIDDEKKICSLLASIIELEGFETSRQLGIGLTTLYRKMDEYNIDPNNSQ